jgi:hypothetical protein
VKQTSTNKTYPYRMILGDASAAANLKLLGAYPQKTFPRGAKSFIGTNGYSFISQDLTRPDTNNVPGQNNPNPPSIFETHAIVELSVPNSPQRLYFDPSYGLEYTNANPSDVNRNLADMNRKLIAGFYHLDDHYSVSAQELKQDGASLPAGTQGKVKVSALLVRQNTDAEKDPINGGLTAKPETY